MSDTEIPLDELDPDRRGRVDHLGRYLIVPPTGGKPRPYTRVTTVAKALDSGGGLAPWTAAMVANGLILRRGLRARWEALMVEHDNNPWYGGQQAKAAAKRVVAEAKAMGGGDDRRDIGSMLHVVSARHDAGLAMPHLTDETEQLLGLYTGGLVAAGINVRATPDFTAYIETTVVLDDYQVAGTFDRLAQVPGFDLPLIADLKTGSNVATYAQSIAVQLAAYSRANAVYQVGAAPDGKDDRRLPMPPVDQDWGLIMAIDVEVAPLKLELYLVDLNAGWEAFGHCMFARGWRNAKPAKPLAKAGSGSPPKAATEPTELIAALQASLDAAADRHPSHPAAPPVPNPVEPPVDPLANPPVRRLSPPTSPAYRAWLQERIDTIGRYPRAREALARHWPADIPTLKKSSAHTAEQIATIQEKLDDIERGHELPFPDPPPTEPDDNRCVNCGATVDRPPSFEDTDLDWWCTACLNDKVHQARIIPITERHNTP